MAPRAVVLILGMLELLTLPRVLGAQQARIVPLRPIPSAQGFEIVSGDSTRPGSPFVLRIHNDAGYRVVPHTHPTDENIVVVQGQWMLGMGRRFDRSVLDSVNLGAYALVPAGMAHFGWSPTEMVMQVYGTIPFGQTWVDPLYALTDSGVVLLPASIGQPSGSPSDAPTAAPSGCFRLAIGDRVRSSRGEGRVVGGECSPANNLTQYCIEQAGGRRYWAILEELRRL